MVKLTDIDLQQAENSFSSIKTALENCTDEKKKIELTSQFKKARSRIL